MVYADIYLSTDCDIRELALDVCEEVKREDDGAVGGVFERDDAAVSGAGLDCTENVFDRGLWRELMLALVEFAGSCLA